MALTRSIQRRKHKGSGIPRTVERRYRSHLQWIRGCLCLVANHDCGASRMEAAHVRKGTDGGTGEKPSDWFVVPLCRRHHSEQHALGEPAFERKHGIDMKAEAERFAKASSNRNIRICAGRRAEDIGLEEMKT